MININFIAYIFRQKQKALYSIALLIVCFTGVRITALAQKPPRPLPPLSSSNGKLVYVADSLGNRIPDFSYAGYAAGEISIPNLPIRIVVPVKAGDATNRIQQAIDYVAGLPLNNEGFRGAVLLQNGLYEVQGALKITASGIVLRGSGPQTVLKGTTASRETLVTISGANDRKCSPELQLDDIYIPVNSNTVHAAGHAFKAGDMVAIRRPSTLNWIKLLGAGHFGGGITALGWKPGQRDLIWERKIISVNGNTLTLDAPLTCALDTAYGGAYISSVQWPGRITNCGIENLALESAYDKANEKDEDHRWMAITIDRAQDCWVRQVSFKYFAGSAVAVFENGRRITVEDCISEHPVSEIGGQRRFTFFTEGQQTLFQRCYAEHGYHDFATGFCAAGPNAFVQCTAALPYSFSGGIDSWSAGTLFDVVNSDGNALSFFNMGQDGQGAGWGAANSVFWNCSAARIDCYNPPGANNWAFGSWSQFAGDGYWGESNNSIQPRSLYYAQLAARTANRNDLAKQVMPVETEASSSPTVAVAMALTAQADKPAPSLKDFIASAGQRNHIEINSNNIIKSDDLRLATSTAAVEVSRMQISNGWLMFGNKIVTGHSSEVPWWSGSSRRYAIAQSRPAITRFVPGRTGTGYTDDLDALTDTMLITRTVAMEQHPPLWYERRRDDHERVRRMDGDVWPPFYEVPQARSGSNETAWDGLSKWDLTKYNQWYWSRLRQFATLADRKDLLLINKNYFQHNIIEAGAHYADYPWRTANNTSNTGFPEPVPYAGDKRIFMASQFYDTTNVQRNKLHRQYIKQNLNAFSGNSHVLQLIGEEFTGPLHFVQFWVDVIRQWERETGKQVYTGLSVTKDVQDAILADPKRAGAIDLIDIHYWYYQFDGTAYAPAGGQNLAPRQHARLLKPKRPSAEQVYRAVREYRDRYPGKAVMYSSDGAEQYGWEIFMAGGSMANIPHITLNGFYESAATMLPADSAGLYTMRAKDGGMLILAGNNAPLPSIATGSWKLRVIDIANGALISEQVVTNGTISVPSTGRRFLIWISKK